MTHPNEITVTVVSSTATGDQYGDSTSTQTRVDVPHALFAPRSSQERTSNAVPAVYTAGAVYLTAGLPTGATLDADDLIEIADVNPMIDGTYKVEGIPGFWDGKVEVAVTRTSEV